jgi:pilus assembly protein TadC
MKKFAAVFVGGALGVVLLKLVFGLIMPLFAMMLGFFALAFKVLVFGLIAYFIYSLIRGKRRAQEDAV